jgi:deoxyribodipyrimidine photolyase-related protein
MMIAALIYPHQLFRHHPALAGADVAVMVEDPLFFSQYAFHKQKLILHRASMKHFASQLASQQMDVKYLEARKLGDAGELAKQLLKWKVTHVQFVDPTDDWLQQRLRQELETAGLSYTQLPDPHFLTATEVIDQFADATAAKKRSWFFTDFYLTQRKRTGILIDRSQKPAGGKWSFDADNRKKLPKEIQLPTIHWPNRPKEVAEAIRYVDKAFPAAPGSAENFCYPIHRQDALRGLHDFIEHRFAHYGEFQDAIDAGQSYLFHSLLTPALNIGLISPQEIVDAALEKIDRVPMNSLEGFIRQVIGWREYIRAVYLKLGRQQRTRNYWQHHRAMPAAFYDGTTGIEPVDVVIRRVLETAYGHHIERLMVLGNFMLLCEISPDAIYQWFMELFIDAYDWVMVPNVYGMSQHADGGMITTKPYISGSAYILKMSNFKKGAWCPIWDGLYWRFIDKHRDFFAANPRMSVMVKQCQRMGSKLAEHHATAEKFLSQL